MPLPGDPDYGKDPAQDTIDEELERRRRSKPPAPGVLPDLSRGAEGQHGWGGGLAEPTPTPSPESSPEPLPGAAPPIEAAPDDPWYIKAQRGFERFMGGR